VQLWRGAARWLVAAAVAASALLIPARAAPADGSVHQLTIRASEFVFQAPARVPGGWTRITIRNVGDEAHQAQVARLNPGVGFGQLQAAAAKGPSAVVPLVTPVGGPNEVAPGRTASTIDLLTPGRYALICFVYSPDGTEHDAKGMLKPLTVTAVTGHTTPPAPNAVITLKDFSYVFPARVHGHGVIAVRNEGTQDHEMVLYHLHPGATLADARQYLLTPPGSPPPIPAPGEPVGGITGVAPGDTGYVDLAVPPGRYVAVCFFPDPTRNGLPHAVEGMLQGVTIR